MLKRMELFATNRPVDVIRHWRNEGFLNLNAPYQRGDVWGRVRRVNLIRSILLGVPIPSIILSDHMKSKSWGDDFSIVVIDGKQRCTAILMFLDDQLRVPRDWFGEVGGDGVFSELSPVNQRRFKGSPIAFSEGALPTIEAEREVFELVNFGGVAQGQCDED